MEKPGRKWASWFYVALYGVILYVALSHLDDVRRGLSAVLSVCAPVIRGLCIAFVLNILVSFLEDKALRWLRGPAAVRRIRRVIAITITLLAGVGLLAALSSVVFPAILDALEMVEKWMRKDQMGWFGKLRVIMIDLGIPTLQVEEYVQTAARWLNELTRFVRTQYAQAAVLALNMTESVLGTAMEAVLSVVIAIYALLCKEWLISLGRRITQAALPPKFSAQVLDMAHRLNRSFQGFIRGQILSGLILGTACMIGMRLLGMEHANVVGVVVGITALIPVVGAWIGGVLGTLLLWMSQGVVMALGFVALLLAVQALEETLIYPRVVGDSVGLPSLLVLCAILVGGRAMGVWGMLMAVPVCAAVYQKLLSVVWPEKEIRTKEKTRRQLPVRQWLQKMKRKKA